MSVYPDFMVRRWAEEGGIDPFDPYMINPASIDLKLMNEFILIEQCSVIDVGNCGINSPKMSTERRIKLESGQKFILQPGNFLLASSVEYVKLTNEMAGLVMLKSSSARIGIGHTFAGWIDPGFEGNITFELFSNVSVILVPNKAICQMVLYKMLAQPEKSYAQTGRYQGQTGPTPAISQVRESIQLSLDDMKYELMEDEEYG